MRLRPFLVLFVLLAVVGTAACDRKDSVNLDVPVPTEPLALRTFLLEKIPGAIEKTNCACCNKSLGLCFRETLSKKGPRCPDT